MKQSEIKSLIERNARLQSVHAAELAHIHESYQDRLEKVRLANQNEVAALRGTVEDMRRDILNYKHQKDSMNTILRSLRRLKAASAASVLVFTSAAFVAAFLAAADRASWLIPIVCVLSAMVSGYLGGWADV